MKTVFRKPSVRWFCKLAAAGALSLALCSLFSWFYYNPPIHVACPEGVTDYKREPNVFWSRGTEGFAAGKTDAFGYNNLEAVSRVDVLYMGSSQTEGLYVAPRECYPAVLDAMFREAGMELTGYNLGMSSHGLKRNVNNLPRALEKYRPKYVVMETNNLFFSQDAVASMLEGRQSRLKSYSSSDPLYWIQKIPYVKLLYLQYKNYTQKGEEEPAAPAVGENASAEMLRYIRDLADTYGCTPIIFYIPPVALSQDGQRVCVTAPELEEFARDCQETGVGFLNMGEIFDREYRENHIVPSGFPNTAVCYGHLNRYGHRFIAEAVFETIRSYERGEQP